MKDDAFLWIVIAFFAGFAWACVLFLGFNDAKSPEGHYVQNVCTYEGGEKQGDVCIVDGKVFEIGKMQ